MAGGAADEVLGSTPVFDGHNGLPVAVRTRAGYGVEGLEVCRPELHTDLPRLRAERLGAQFWSVYVSSKLPEPEAVVATLERIDAVYRLAARYKAMTCEESINQRDRSRATLTKKGGSAWDSRRSAQDRRRNLPQEMFQHRC